MDRTATIPQWNKYFLRQGRRPEVLPAHPQTLDARKALSLLLAYSATCRLYPYLGCRPLVQRSLLLGRRRLDSLLILHTLRQPWLAVRPAWLFSMSPRQVGSGLRKLSLVDCPWLVDYKWESPPLLQQPTMQDVDSGAQSTIHAQNTRSCEVVRRSRGFSPLAFSILKIIFTTGFRWTLHEL